MIAAAAAVPVGLARARPGAGRVGTPGRLPVSRGSGEHDERHRYGGCGGISPWRVTLPDPARIVPRRMARMGDLSGQVIPG